MSDEVKHDAPLAVATEQRSRRTLALVLVLIGMLLLLRSALPMSSRPWSILLPLGLVGLGLDLVTSGRYRNKIVAGGLLAALALSLLVSFSPPHWNWHRFKDAATSQTLVLSDERHLQAEVEVTAGNLSIEALPASSDAVAQLADDGDLTYQKEDSTGVLAVRPPRWRSSNIDLQLTRQLPLSLAIHVNAGNAEPLDFEDLQLQQLDLRVRAGNTTIKLPSRGAMDVTVDCLAGNVQIEVPEELAAMIEVNNFGQLDLGDRFQQRGTSGVFVTDDYDPTTPNRVVLHITSRGGNIEID
jgi:hypothetical protein